MRPPPQRPGRLSPDQLIEALLALLVFATAATLPMQNDSWWQLRTGLEIWQRKEVPRHDIFSFAMPRQDPWPWPNHEWLAQVIFYVLYRLGGLPLLTLSCAALCSLSLLPSYLLGQGRPLRRACLLVIALPLIRVGWAVRPQVFTLLFLLTCLWLIVRERYLLLPLLFVVWANLHGGVTLGGLLMVGSVVAALIEVVFYAEGEDAAHRSRRRLARLVLATGGCGLATLLTPLGLHILTFPFTSVRRLKEAGISEWRSPDVHSVGGVLFWLFAGLFVYALLTGWRRLRCSSDRLLVVLAALFLGMAIASLRNVPHFLLVAVPAITRLSPALSGVEAALPGSEDGHAAGDGSRSNLLIALLAAACVVGFLGYAYSLPLPRLEWQPMSRSTIAAVRGAPEPMYNTYDNGGYLLWFTPERKVFIDSRQDPFPTELLMLSLRAFRTGEYEPLFARYPVRSAAVEPTDPVGRRLLARGWRKAFEDDHWLVLIAP